MQHALPLPIPAERLARQWTYHQAPSLPLRRCTPRANTPQKPSCSRRRPPPSQQQHGSLRRAPIARGAMGLTIRAALPLPAAATARPGGVRPAAPLAARLAGQSRQQRLGAALRTPGSSLGTASLRHEGPPQLQRRQRRTAVCQAAWGAPLPGRGGRAGSDLTSLPPMARKVGASAAGQRHALVRSRAPPLHFWLPPALARTLLPSLLVVLPGLQGGAAPGGPVPLLERQPNRAHGQPVCAGEWWGGKAAPRALLLQPECHWACQCSSLMRLLLGCVRLHMRSGAALHSFY